MLRRTTQLALGTALIAAAATFAPAASAGNVGFNVSIAGPGYGVSFGNAPYYGHRHYYRPYYRGYGYRPYYYGGYRPYARGYVRGYARGYARRYW